MNVSIPQVPGLCVLCCSARAWIWDDECLGPPCSWFWARPPEFPLSTHQNYNLYKLPELPARPSPARIDQENSPIHQTLTSQFLTPI